MSADTAYLIYLDVEVGRLLISLRGLAITAQLQGVPAGTEVLAWIQGPGTDALLTPGREPTPTGHYLQPADEARLLSLEAEIKRRGAALEAAMRSGGPA